jgi:hypothetical protein
MKPLNIWLAELSPRKRDCQFYAIENCGKQCQAQKKKRVE